MNLRVGEVETLYLSVLIVLDLALRCLGSQIRTYVGSSLLPI